MKALTVAGTVMLAGIGAAHADMTKFNGAGYWEADAGTNDSGTRMCTISTSGGTAANFFYFGMKAANHRIFFQLSRGSWNVPKGTRMTVNMQIDGAEGWHMTMAGEGRNIAGAIPSTDRVPGEGWITYIINLMGNGNTFHISFPEGNTPPWNLSLAGSAAMLQSFDRCLVALDPSIANPAPTGQPYGTDSGQPYGNSVPQQPQQQPQPASPPANKYYWGA